MLTFWQFLAFSSLKSTYVITRVDNSCGCLLSSAPLTTRLKICLYDKAGASRLKNLLLKYFRFILDSKNLWWFTYSGLCSFDSKYFDIFVNMLLVIRFKLFTNLFYKILADILSTLPDFYLIHNSCIPVRLALEMWRWQTQQIYSS